MMAEFKQYRRQNYRVSVPDLDVDIPVGVHLQEYYSKKIIDALYGKMPECTFSGAAAADISWESLWRSRNSLRLDNVVEKTQ